MIVALLHHLMLARRSSKGDKNKHIDVWITVQHMKEETVALTPGLPELNSFRTCGRL